MAITASAVKELRELTGAGMMECKKALTESDGDIERATELLRIKGIAKADKKADRVAAEGIIATAISSDLKTGALVEINCETDFVARNEKFVAFGEQVAALIVRTGITDVEALSGESLGSATVDEARRNLVASIGENIDVRRASLLAVDGPGFVASYVHTGSTMGVLIAVGTEAADHEDARQLGADLAMHIAAFAPVSIDESGIDPALLEAEKSVLMEQALESGKPREIVEKMIVGRLQKWKKDVSLVDQEFVRDPDSSVAQVLKSTSAKVGSSLTVQRFDRMVRGEGIEKKQSNLAEEVAATLR